MADDVFAAYDEPESDEQPKARAYETGAQLFLQSIGAALARVPLWLVTWAALSLLALAVALPWYHWYADASANRLAPGEGVYNLSQVFRFDHAVGLGAMGDATARLAVILGFAATLLGVFAAGGWLQVILERTRGTSLRRFLYGGARYFWRFFRVWILVMLALSLLHWVTHGLPWERFVLAGLKGVPEVDWGTLESLDTELEARKLAWLQDGLAALGFLLVMIWAVFIRTRLALHDTRSVLWAGACTFGSLLARPIKMLRPMVLLYLAEFLIVSVLFGRLTRFIDAGIEGDPTQWRILALLGMGSLALAMREILFGARYHAAVRVSQETIHRPDSRPDPWRAIGGPGGPQYPVDYGGDEYGVSM